MIVEFHGVRGSIPMPSSSTIKYGGHTSCYEVVTDKYQFIFDAGTGFQSVKLMEDRTVVIIFTHFHHQLLIQSLQTMHTLDSLCQYK